MSIAFWWIPNVLAAIGLVVCIVQGIRHNSAVAAPFTQAVLVFAAVLLSRRITARRAA